MTDRYHFMESAIEPPTPLSLLSSIVEAAERYRDYPEGYAQRLYDHQLADFLLELRDEPAGGQASRGSACPAVGRRRSSVAF